MRTVVCAGSYREFLFWCREQGISPRDRKRVIYATEVSLRGIQGPIEVVVVGTWAERPGRWRIAQDIMIIEQTSKEAA